MQLPHIFGSNHEDFAVFGRQIFDDSVEDTAFNSTGIGIRAGINRVGGHIFFVPWRSLKPTELIETDFLVIGAGVAGLRAAIELSGSGKVLVVAKDSLRESASEYAQGGIAVALSDDDEIWLHEQDTLSAGDGLCNVEAVRTLVAEAPEAIEELIQWGAEFDRKDGELQFGREGAHSRNRILHAHGDSTGREIARALYHHAAKIENITFRSFAAVTDLMMDNGCVTGAMAFTDGPVAIAARATLLATGGLGRVFLETTNPDVATGDGVAMAWRAGALISDIEFVQFHPTALHVDGAPRFLLSEALRGDGAYLRNAAGERFTNELNSRDQVSRAIVAEIEKTGTKHVFLDMTHWKPGFAAEHFPRIFETCMAYGLDMATTPIPVHPAAHYAMGGVETDLDGSTNLPGLYAAGEVASTGVHGANRLASNSLLEGLVYGARAGRAMAAEAGPMPTAGHVPGVVTFPELSESAVRGIAWRYCGLVRDAAGLETAIAKLQVASHARPDAVRDAYELRNIHSVAGLIAVAALARCESRGGHYRSDFPLHGPEPAKHSRQGKQISGVEFWL